VIKTKSRKDFLNYKYNQKSFHSVHGSIYLLNISTYDIAPPDTKEA